MKDLEKTRVPSIFIIAAAGFFSSHQSRGMLISMLRIRPPAAAPFLAAFLLGVMPVAAAADARPVYVMTGQDTYQIGAFRRAIRFGGEERVRVVKRGTETTLASDKSENDPDTLSVANQPLPAVLRNDEVRALNALAGRTALDLPSSFTETSLAGFLEPVTPRATGDLIGLRFMATAESSGPLPNYPNVVVDGVLTMQGTAYYARSSGVLERIESRLTFDGHIRGEDATVPVHVSYERNIHVVAPTIALRRAAR